MEKVKPKLFRQVYKNTCLACGHDHLWLIEYDKTSNKLNPNGMISESYTEGSKSYLQCANCGERFNAKKVGMSYQIDLGIPKILKIMDEFNPFQSNFEEEGYF